jgi:hypothetical protein
MRAGRRHKLKLSGEWLAYVLRIATFLFQKERQLDIFVERQLDIFMERQLDIFRERRFDTFQERQQMYIIIAHVGR